MKKPKLAKRFLEELSVFPNVSSVCFKLGLSRNTVYRWREEDLEFKKEMDQALIMGIESGNDIAENQLFKAVKAGAPWAVRYWLDNNKKNYVRPRPKAFWENYAGSERVEKITIEIVPGRKPNEEAPREVIEEVNDQGPSLAVPHTLPND